MKSSIFLIVFSKEKRSGFFEPLIVKCIELLLEYVASREAVVQNCITYFAFGVNVRVSNCFFSYTNLYYVLRSNYSRS